MTRRTPEVIEGMRLPKLVILITLLSLGTFFAGGAAPDLWDIGIYFQYAQAIVDGGQIPYVNLQVEYPQIAILSIIAPYLIARAVGDPIVFIIAHMAIMFLMYVITAVLTYRIVLTLFNHKGRALVSAVLMGTALPAIYFTVCKYDAFPTLILMASLYCFVHGDATKGYLWGVVGFFTKWFAFICVPFYIIHNIKNGISFKKPLIIGAIFAAVITVPLLILNFENVAFAYVYHGSRPAQAESVFFLLDSIVGTGFFSDIGNYVMLVAEGLLLYTYYRLKDNRMVTLVGFVALSVFVFVVFNKVFSPQYILWVTPLLAILLSRTIKNMVWFYVLQGWMWLEFPILFKNYYDCDNYLLWTPSVLFFTVKFVFWFAVLYVLYNEVMHDVSAPS